MRCIKLLCFLAFGATPFNALTNDEAEVLYDMNLIIKDYLQNSAIPRHEHDIEEVLRHAEEFYKYEKARGISIRRLLGDAQANFTAYSGRGNSPSKYKHVKNTQYENLVPTWDLLPHELDRIAFDHIRYERYLTSYNNPSFKRRITWLYPKDGNQNVA